MAHPCGCVVGLALLPWPVCAGPSPDIFCLQAEWLPQSPSAAVEAKSTGAPSPSYILSGRKSKETLLGVSPVGSSLAGPLPGRGEQLPQQQGLDLPLSCSAAEAAAAAAADRREPRVLSSPARLLGNTQQLPARPGPAPGSQTIPGSRWHRAAAVPWDPGAAAVGRRDGHPPCPRLGLASLTLELQQPMCFLCRPRIPVTLNMKMVMPSWSVLRVAGEGGTLLEVYFGE